MKKYKKAYIEITNVCNKSCSFCHGTKREKAFMSEENFEKALKSLSGVVDYLYFHLLGEPLCHPKFPIFLEKAIGSGFKVSLTTNGTLLKKHSDTLLSFPPYKISVSLHSFEEGEGQREYLEEVIKFAKKCSKKGTLISLRLWNKGTFDNSFTEKILREHFTDKWQEGRGDTYTLDTRIYLEYEAPFRWPDMEDAEHGKEVFCYGLRDQFGILVDGSVVPCCLDAEGDMILGNIFTQPLEKILTSTRATAIKEGFDNRKTVEELCKKCTFRLKRNFNPKT